MIFKRLFKQPEKKGEKSREISAELIRLARLPLVQVFEELRASEKGLDQREAGRRFKQFGPNEIAHEKPPRWYLLLLLNFRNPFVVLLLVIGTLSIFLKELDSTIIIGIMLAISVLMRFIQEYRSSRAAEKLKALVSTKVTVLRRHNHEEAKSRDVNIKHIVPGDIIHLSAGDMVPADVRLIISKGLYLSQAALSGESLPVEKEHNLHPKDKDTNPLDTPNLCLLGTNILNGTATAIVLKTGDSTFFGAMSTSIVGYRSMTSFDQGINKVSWLLIRFILIMVPIIFILNGFTKRDWLESFLFSLSVAIGLTPEMLPMVVTANLARGAVKMSQRKVIVKSLNSIQNFGAMDLLCTDKTGTLTENRIVLEKYLDSEANESREVLLYGYLNSFYQTGLKNLLDLAVLDHKEIEGSLNPPYTKIDELPFDFTRRRMSVVLQHEPEKHLLVCKGAVEEVQSVCASLRVQGKVAPINAETQKKLGAIQEELSADGLRVLALAYKEISSAQREYTVKDETDLIFLGFLAFLDPPKHSAIQAIAKLRDHGVQVKVMTGDNELVAQKICKAVKLENSGTLLGSQIDAMSDDELESAAQKNSLFAKLDPLQKSRVIIALKKSHTVGYLGDGINDAPALREADIGISVDTAVDIAKESADIIMLEKSLLFLVEGVIEGRKTFGNIIKYIKMALSSNFGNVFSFLGASIIFPFLPMLPVQILLQNLLYDLSQTMIPFDHVDQEFLLKPRKWDPRGIAKFILFIGPISSIFDYLLFALMWFYFSANTMSSQNIFQTGWFIEGLLSQTLIVHMIRTQKIPFIQSMPSQPLLWGTILIMAFGMYIPYSFFGPKIGLVPLSGTYFLWLTGILLGYCFLTQLIKTWFVRKFNYWL